jgi:hypothetical protein
VHQDDQRELVANLPTSGKVAWLERVALADARGLPPGERKLVRRSAPLRVQETRLWPDDYQTTTHCRPTIR